MTFLIFIISFTVAGAYGWNDDRIVGGRPAYPGELPYQVSIRRSYNDAHFCGGSVIGPSHILTAAHCMYYVWGGVLPAITVSIIAGQLQLTVTNQSIYRNASTIHIHEGYDSKSKVNDIAIIEVDEPFPLDNERVSIAALSFHPAASKTKCTVSGWGYTSFDKPVVSENLLVADVEIIDFKQCEDMYAKANISLANTMICAGVPEGGKDACQGDSGGPLFCEGYLTGIVSTGVGCADKDYPGLYTDVSRFTPWINYILHPNRKPNRKFH